MEKIFETIGIELKKGREAVLATIVSHKGSTPRRPGTRMVIRANGSFMGTIGGGKLEADVLAEAERVFRQGKNKILNFKMEGETAAQADMICGGELEVYLEFFSEKAFPWIDFVEKLLNLVRTGRPALLGTLLEEGSPLGPEGGYFLYLPELEGISGDIPWLHSLSPSFSEILAQKLPVLATAPFQGSAKKVFLEPLVSLPRLYIFGAGHVSSALCSLVKRIGFMVTVIDDRPEFASPLRFPEADELIVMPFEQATKNLFFAPEDSVVIMTRGHLYDQMVLGRILNRPLLYLGMIGSRRKGETIFNALREENVSEELLKTIHTPIGLEIGAETPEEIAISIAAELIQVRARKRGGKK